MNNRKNRNLVIGIACASLIVKGISSEAFSYCEAAKRDEGNEFPLTAAMEWRTAAELAAPIPQLAEACWKEWERIINLPRHLALPIGEVPAVQVRPGAELKKADGGCTEVVDEASCLPLAA